MKLTMQLDNLSYDIIIQKDCLKDVDKYFSLNRKVLVVSDDGVPNLYIDTVLLKCKKGYKFIFKHGEESKNIDTYQKILSFLIENNFTRSDCIIAVGGGVVSDLVGFVCATYLRGITFYVVATTLLSQVDASIGGKTAIDYNGYKNVVGAFYQPSKVLIDTNTLNTLSSRQFNAGMAEIIKMATTSNENLFKILEDTKDIKEDIDNIIYEALLIKQKVVQIDPLENNIRKVLNFGHTIGHAIESYYNMTLLHGECVSLGMVYMSSSNVKERLIPLLKKFNLPVKLNDLSNDELVKYIYHDKKATGDFINIVFVKQIGSYEFRKIKIEEIKNYL